jgi:HD-like signal output (HDOD) protein
MTTATEIHPSADRVLRELDSLALRTMVSEIGIPSRPSVLRELKHELKRDDPSLSRLTEIVGADVALSAALLRTTNSALFGLSRRAETIEQAFMLLGFANCQALFTEILLRRLLPVDGPTMQRFWDVSARRAQAMTYLARTRRIVSPALAHTCGLFLDVGIPLLARRFPGPSGYLSTLARANESLEPFTAVEQQMHRFDHTLVGAMAARSWGVSQTAVLAVRLHHDYASWTGARPLPGYLPQLLGLALACDHIVQRFENLNRHLEWEKGGDAALRMLGVDDREFFGWCEEVHHQFEVTAG